MLGYYYRQSLLSSLMSADCTNVVIKVHCLLSQQIVLSRKLFLRHVVHIHTHRSRSASIILCLLLFGMKFHPVH